MAKDMSSIFKYIKILSEDINKESKQINNWARNYENVDIFALTSFEKSDMNIGVMIEYAYRIEKNATRMRKFVDAIIRSLK